jgi:protein involved in polysaccharide export with SLBB domain
MPSNSGSQINSNSYQTKNPTKSAKREVISTPREKIRTDSISNSRIAQSTNNLDFNKIDTAVTNLKRKIFGYSIFNNKGGTFEPNLKIATPQNYIVGPDDEIIVDINGYSEEHYTLTVNPDGYVKINKIGNVYVAGLSMEEVRARLIKKLSTIFIGLKRAGASTNINSNNLYASISLGNIRTVSVTVQGEVNFPGTYSVPSLARVFNVLYLAGGPNENGTFREVQLIRNNRIISTIDLYDYLTQGYSKTDFLVHDQDIIKVGVYKTRIELKGKVKKSGLFEVLPTEKLDFIINNFAGGYTEDAFRDKLKIVRFTNTERKLLDISSDVLSSFSPKSGDIIQVEPINLERFENRLEIIGEVFRPGLFSLENNPTLKKLIVSAGGLKENAFVGRINIQRLGSDLNPSNLSVNIAELLSNKVNDIVLQREDKIYVYSKFDLREAYTVTLHGEINGVRDRKASNQGKSNTRKSNEADDYQQEASSNKNELENRESESKSVIDDKESEAESEISEDLKSNNASNSLLNRQVKLTLPYVEKMTVEDLILKGGGLRESAATGFVEVVRRKKNTSIANKDLINSQIAEITKFSISANLELDKTSSSFLLEPFDEVFVRSSPNYELQQFITIKGQVFYPGIYGLEKKDERISDILLRAGGLNPQAYPEGAKLLRISQVSESEKKMKSDQLAEIQDNFSNVNINKEKATSTKHETIGIDLVDALNNPGGVNDLFLNEGDILDIPKEPQTVKVTGEVLYPNSVKFTSSYNVKDYISQAGGFTSSSARKRIYVLYSNGSVKRAKNLLFLKFYPRIEKGSEIIVPQKVKLASTSQQIVSIVSVLTGTVTSIIGIITLMKATAQ